MLNSHPQYKVYFNTWTSWTEFVTFILNQHVFANCYFYSLDWRLGMIVKNTLHWYSLPSCWEIDTDRNYRSYNHLPMSAEICEINWAASVRNTISPYLPESVLRCCPPKITTCFLPVWFITDLVQSMHGSDDANWLEGVFQEIRFVMVCACSSLNVPPWYFPLAFWFGSRNQSWRPPRIIFPIHWLQIYLP